MSKVEIEIGSILPEEVDDVCKIAVAAWTAIHEGYRKVIQDDDLYGRISHNWQEKKANSIREKIEKTPDEVLVARDRSGKVLGFITFYIKPEVQMGEIGNNAVIPECQGQGIGKQLYKRVLDLFREKGLVYATVSTGYEDEGHAKARAGYERAGFKKMSTSITYSLKL